MAWLKALSIFVTAIGLRFLIPIAVTISVVYVLRKLDARWQEEAEAHLSPSLTAFDGPRCFDVKKCSAEQRENCSAANQSQPCWQVFRKENNGLLDEKCLSCGYFANMPIPTVI